MFVSVYFYGGLFFFLFGDVSKPVDLPECQSAERSIYIFWLIFYVPQLREKSLSVVGYNVENADGFKVTAIGLWRRSVQQTL